MVLGILWLGFVGSILALVFGYVSRNQIDKSHGTQSGRGMAVAGIVLGWVGVATALAVVVVVTTITLLGSNDSSKSATESFCAELTTDNAIFNNLGSEASDSEQAIQLFDNLTKKAPSEVKAEMQTLRDFLKHSVSDASALAADPSPSRSSSRDSLISDQSSSLAAASDKVATFASEKCHLKLGPDSSSTFSSVASSISN